VATKCGEYICSANYVPKAGVFETRCPLSGCTDQLCCNPQANNCAAAFANGYTCPVAYRPTGLIRTVACPNHICTQGTCCLIPTCQSTYDATLGGLLTGDAALTCPARYRIKATASTIQCRENDVKTEPRCSYTYCCEATCKTAGVVCAGNLQNIANFDNQVCSNNRPQDCNTNNCCTSI